MLNARTRSTLMKSISEHDDVPQSTNPQVHFLTAEEGRALFERQAHRRLGMSGDEFIRAYEAGELADHPNQSDVEFVAFLIPLAAL
jgi:hypothetical protein